MIGASFAVTSIVFLLFAVGLVVAFQGVVGHDPDLYTEVWGPHSNRWRPDRAGPSHPPDRHRLLRVAIGVGMMAVAVLLAIVFIG